MFVNFNKTFKSKRQAQTTIPQEYVDYLSKGLPQGLQYVLGENNNLILSSGENVITIGGFKISTKQEFSDKLGANYTEKDILAYGYNAQVAVEIVPEREGVILLNGVEFPVDKLVVDPIHKVQFLSGKYYLLPEKLPDPFILKFGCKDYSRDMTIRRIPNKENAYVALFQSNEGEVLITNYSYDYKAKKFTFNISIKLANAQSIKDLVESISIYNAFYDGNGLLNDSPKCIGIRSEGTKRFSDDSIAFWKKVLVISETLNQEFVPQPESVTYQTAYMVERLYQNLIENTPIRDDMPVTTLNGDAGLSDDDLKKLQDTEMCYAVEASEEVELFNKTIQLPMIVYIFNAKIKKCTRGKNAKIELDNFSADKRIYSASLMFSSEESMSSFQNSNPSSRQEDFSVAKPIAEYIV